MKANIPVIGVWETKHSKTTYQMNMDYFEDNLIFKKDKSCWAVYKIKNYSYDFDSARDKINLHNKLTKLFWGIADEFHIVDVPSETSIREKNAQLKKMARGPLKHQAVKEIDQMTEELVEMLGDKGNHYDTYLVIKLKIIKSLFRSIGEWMQSTVQDPVRAINRWAGLDDPEIYLREFEMYKQLDELMFAKLKRHTPMTRANERDIQYLIRYPFYFGIGAPPVITYKSKPYKPKVDYVEVNGQTVMRPRPRQLMHLVEGDIDIKAARHLKVMQIHKGAEKVAYQAYMVISDMPDSVVPGGEWLFYLKEHVNFPIYTSIRGSMVDNKTAKDELGRKRKEIEDQEEHIRKTDEAQVPLDVLEQIEDAALMDNDLKQSKSPLIYTTIIIGVAAADHDELLRRIDAVKTVLDPIPVEVPAGDQWLMFNEINIAGEQYQRDYRLRLPPGHLALVTPGASQEIGDTEGYYIGVTGALQKPVYIGPWLPSQLNKAPNASFTGTQGGGKSFGCDLIALKAVKYIGAKALFIDPKGDRTLWPKLLPSFENQVEVTTFSSDEENKGKLDPYIVMAGADDGSRAERMREASMLAMDIGMFLLAADRKDPRFRYLLEATQLTELEENPCMEHVINHLAGKLYQDALADDDQIKANTVKDMASHFRSFKHMAYSNLIFGDETSQGIKLERQVNVLQIQNLVFPEEGKSPEDFSVSEIVGYACLLAITGYVMRFIMSDRAQFKIFVLDETVVLKATPAGRNTINKLQRMARAMNAPGYFLGQSVDDVGDEKVRNNIGYKFAFKTKDPDEISKVLRYFKLEDSEANHDMLANLETGTCLFQDHEDRTAIIIIDYLFEEYAVALNTTPDMAGGE